MSDGWWLVVIGAGVLAWSVVLDVRLHIGDRLARWWVPRAERRGRWAGPAAFVISSVPLVAYLVMALVGAGIASAAGDERMALVTVVPAIALYAPYAFETMPARGSGYASWREALRAAGARAGLDRTIAWWAGPPSLLGMVAMCVTMLPIVVN
jgi:hypothetical protein